jgi:hypothetical protein
LRAKKRYLRSLACRKIHLRAVWRERCEYLRASAYFLRNWVS